MAGKLGPFDQQDSTLPGLSHPTSWALLHSQVHFFPPLYSSSLITNSPRLLGPALQSLMETVLEGQDPSPELLSYPMLLNPFMSPGLWELCPWAASALQTQPAIPFSLHPTS